MIRRALSGFWSRCGIEGALALAFTYTFFGLGAALLLAAGIAYEGWK